MICIIEILIITITIIITILLITDLYGPGPADAAAQQGYTIV